MADSLFNGAQSAWLQIAQNAFKDGRDYFDAGVRLDIERDIRQFQGLHPAGSKYLSNQYQTRSKFFRPKTRATIRKNEAVAASALFSNNDVVEITAWDDSSDIQRASAMLNKELLNLRLKQYMPWFHVSIGGYQDGQVNGAVAGHIYWKTDEKKGIDQPWVDLVPLENLVISPSASWFDPINSSPYVIELIPMLVKDVVGRMNVVPGKTETAKWAKLDDSVILQAVHGFSDSIRLEREGKRPDSRSQPSTLSPYQLVWVHKVIADVDGTDYLWYTLGNSQLLSPGRPLSESYWHGKRPYVMGYVVLEAHKLYPPGVSRLTRELQAELNENANQRSDNVKFAMNKRYFGKRGAQLDVKSLTRNVPSSVTLMNDPEKDVKVQETKDVTQSAFEEQDRLNMDFDEISGSNSKGARGDVNRLANTVGGAEMLTDDANQIEGYQLRTYVETFIEPVLNQVMLLEQHYETDEKILELCGKKAALDQLGITTIDDNLVMQELSLAVHVGIGATSPRKQLDNLLWGLAKMVELLQTPVLSQYGLDVEALMNEIFGKLGYRTADRFFKWDDQDPQVVALNNQVKDLTDALKNKKDPPEIVAAKVQLLTAQVKKTLNEAFNVNVEGLFASMQAAELVAAVPDVAPVADTIAKAGGYEQPVPVGQDPGIQPVQSAGPLPGSPDGVAPAGGGVPPAPGPVGPNPDANGAAQGPAPGVEFTKNGVVNNHTGLAFHPGGSAGATASVALPPGVHTNTSPLKPAKAGSADVGAHAGIEGGKSGNAAPMMGGEPPAAAIDPEEAKHRRAMELEEHKIKLKAKYGKPDKGAASAESYRQKKDSQKALADQEKKRAQDKKESDERHAAHLKAIDELKSGQQDLAKHITKPKPKIVVKRDKDGNITSFEPQD